MSEILRLPGGDGHLSTIPADDAPLHARVIVFDSNESGDQADSTCEPGEPRPERVPYPSDPGIADAIIEAFDRQGRLVVFTEGEFYEWLGTHWRVVPLPQRRRWAYPFDGLILGQSSAVRLSKGRINSILYELASKLDKPGFFEDPPRGVNAANGFVQLDEFGRPSLRAHDPRFRQRFVLAGRYLPGTRPKNDALIRTLLQGAFLGDPDGAKKALMLMEVAGAIVAGLGTHLKEPKAIVLWGVQGAGKSQVLDTLVCLVPKDKVTAIPITDFGYDRYRVRLAGAALNISAELGAGDAVASDKFKAIITGDEVSGRNPHYSVVSFRPVATHVFATNELPAFNGGMSPAVTRRLLVIAFGRVIPKSEQVANLGRRIAEEEADALLWHAVRGAGRLIRHGRFTESRGSREALSQWVRDSDSVLGYLDDDQVVVIDPAAEPVPTKDIFESYRAWCAQQGVRAVSLRQFVLRTLAGGRGVTKTRDRQRRYLVGLRLRRA